MIARLHETRRESENSQEGLARPIGASWPSVSRWERGKAKPVEDSLVRMERLLLLEQKIKPALKPGTFKRFLFTPHPLLDNFAPVDLLQSGSRVSNGCSGWWTACSAAIWHEGAGDSSRRHRRRLADRLGGRPHVDGAADMVPSLAPALRSSERTTSC